MFFILLFTIIGFLIGLLYVVIKRKLRPANVLTSTIFGLLILGIGKIFKEFFEKNLKGGGKRWVR